MNSVSSVNLVVFVPSLTTLPNYAIAASFAKKVVVWQLLLEVHVFVCL